MKTPFFKTLIVVFALAFGAFSFSRNAKADYFVSPFGTVLSDTCVAPNGTYMRFFNQMGPVGSMCSFSFFGVPAVFYGTYR